MLDNVWLGSGLILISLLERFSEALLCILCRSIFSLRLTSIGVSTGNIFNLHLLGVKLLQLLDLVTTPGSIYVEENISAAGFPVMLNESFITL
jgi:hypothetical protein